MHNNIILWDLHEVVFKRNLFHWIYLFLTYPKKWQVIRSLDWYIIFLFLRYILHITYIKRAEFTSQDVVDHARKKKADALVDLILLIATDYQPIPQTVDIIHALHKKGYLQYIGSNIGIDVFERFQKMYPTIFKYFDGKQIVFYENGTLIKKPNPQFFTHFLKNYNYDAASVLFLDDKPYNVQAASAVGLHAILFKNPAQLKQALIAHGFIF